MVNILKHVSLNMNVRGVDQSPTLAINERSWALEDEGQTVFRLGLGQSPFPVPVPVVDEMKNHAHEKDYLPVKGLPALRTAVANFHRRKDDLDVRPEQVIVGPGSKELLFLLQLVYYGELIVPTPCWVTYVPQAAILGKQVRLVPTSFEERWRMTAENFERICEQENDKFRPRILILNYPGNPEGGTYTADELKAIAEVARKYEVILLSDEIYGQLHHRGEHVSVARYYPEGTIISSGLSKWCGAGGWRLGTFAFPRSLDWLLESIAAVASETYTSVCAPVQYAAVRAFTGGVRIERYLWHARRILAALGGECARILTAAGIRVHPPEGGFYLFPDFTPLAAELEQRGVDGSESLQQLLLEETGVALLPGTSFGRPEKELTVRLAYVDFDGSGALAASETHPLDEPLPEDFTRQYCFKVVEAVRRIARWVKG